MGNGAAQGFSTARDGLGTARSTRTTPRAEAAPPPPQPQPHKRKKKKSLLTRLLNKLLGKKATRRLLAADKDQDASTPPEATAATSADHTPFLESLKATPARANGATPVRSTLRRRESVSVLFAPFPGAGRRFAQVETRCAFHRRLQLHPILCSSRETAARWRCPIHNLHAPTCIPEAAGCDVVQRGSSSNMEPTCLRCEHVNALECWLSTRFFSSQQPCSRAGVPCLTRSGCGGGKPLQGVAAEAEEAQWQQAGYMLLSALVGAAATRAGAMLGGFASAGGAFGFGVGAAPDSLPLSDDSPQAAGSSRKSMEDQSSPDGSMVRERERERDLPLRYCVVGVSEETSKEYPPPCRDLGPSCV